MSAITLIGVAVPDELAKRLRRASRATTKWRDERDALIRQAYEAGGGIREIARLADLSHPGIRRILKLPAGRARTQRGARDDPPSQSAQG